MAEKRINQKTPQGPRSGRVVEKPKDFFGSLSRLLKYTGRYFPLMVTAVVLAVAGAIFAIVGPGQLSKITDLITSGITGGGIDMDAVIAACLFGDNTQDKQAAAQVFRFEQQRRYHIAYNERC